MRKNIFLIILLGCVLNLPFFDEQENEKSAAGKNDNPISIMYAAIHNEKKNNILDVTIDLLNKTQNSDKTILSLDIYPKSNPGHPERHFGFWNISLNEKIDEIYSINYQLDPITKRMIVLINGKEISPSFWIGKLNNNEEYIANFAIWKENKPEEKKVYNLIEFELKNQSFNIIKVYNLKKEVTFN